MAGAWSPLLSYPIPTKVFWIFLSKWYILMHSSSLFKVHNDKYCDGKNHIIFDSTGTTSNNSTNRSIILCWCSLCTRADKCPKIGSKSGRVHQYGAPRQAPAPVPTPLHNLCFTCGRRHALRIRISTLPSSPQILSTLSHPQFTRSEIHRSAFYPRPNPELGSVCISLGYRSLVRRGTGPKPNPNPNPNQP